MRFNIKKRKEKEAFERYIRDLRDRYEGKVRWFDKRIEQLAAAEDW